jgi:hypothetical protein
MSLIAVLLRQGEEDAGCVVILKGEYRPRPRFDQRNGGEAGLLLSHMNAAAFQP